MAGISGYAAIVVAPTSPPPFLHADDLVNIQVVSVHIKHTPEPQTARLHGTMSGSGVANGCSESPAPVPLEYVSG